MLDFLDEVRQGFNKLNANSKQKEIIKVLLTEKIVSEYNNKIYFNNGFYYGKMDINSKGDGFLQASFLERDLLIKSKDLHSARYGDIVIAKKIKKQKGRPSAAVILVLKREEEFSLVITQMLKNVVFGKCFKTGLLRQLSVSQKSLKALPVGTILKVDNASSNVVEVLGHISDEKVDEKISMALFNKTEEFDKACLDEANAYSGSVDASFYPDRLDLRHLPFCTIDPIHAKDFDDAIYFDEKNQILYVAIADVSEYVRAFSALDNEALKRGFSIYFPHKSIPMLPRVLSEGICSLNPYEDRLCFGFKIYFEGAKVIKEEIYEGIINSKRRFNYDEVDEYLDKKTDLKECNYLYSLNELTKKIRNARLNKGFNFLTEELRMEIDSDWQITKTYYEQSTRSHQLIEDCMLLANKAAAKMCPDLAIFRNHQSPNYNKITAMYEELQLLGLDFSGGENIYENIKNIQSLADELNIRAEVDKIIIRSFKKAEYGHENKGHFALGFERYSHFTSPIRRYSDLILHRLLKALMKNQDKLFTYLSTNLENKCFEVSNLEREADKVAMDFCDRVYARYFHKNIGKRFYVKITKNEDITIGVLDDEFKGARIFIANPNVTLFSRVLVEIYEVDLISAKVFARIVKDV
ncbi:RNB domain-containing ribonuclease [Campylobacter sp. MG1]|uniref:RNB domain-containing ribonuclease n=1 Tax=Campylobacter sp. MG1 TaxID=2976332 RepID=UPI00226D3F92|nr:ribonuclease R family protein [Campylobacter sp. MG1]